MTGLPNRVLLLDRLNHEVLRQQRSGQPVAVLYLDVDELKTINDTQGHAVGDTVLMAVGDRLAMLLRPGTPRPA